MASSGRRTSNGGEASETLQWVEGEGSERAHDEEGKR